MEQVFSQFNLLAVIVSSIVCFIIGAVWFGPKTFYPVWMKALGREVPEERVKMTGGETLLMFGGTYLAALIQVSTLGIIVAAARLLHPVTWGTGLFLGFLFSVGLGAFASLSHRMFAQPDFKIYKSLKVWLIEVGQDVVCLTIAGAILGAWS
ncbi:MAG: DUF1761 domain-containing protein [Actinobacteria bacterium]|nr:DUF1761 domain-containing protein [Actinomycetota bacterium]